MLLSPLSLSLEKKVNSTHLAILVSSNQSSIESSGFVFIDQYLTFFFPLLLSSTSRHWFSLLFLPCLRKITIHPYIYRDVLLFLLSISNCWLFSVSSTRVRSFTLIMSTTWINGEFLTFDQSTIILKMIEWIKKCRSRTDVASFSFRSVMNVNNWLVTGHLNSHCHDETRAIDVNVYRVWLNIRIIGFLINRRRRRCSIVLLVLDDEGHVDDMIWRKRTYTHLLFQWQNLIIYRNINFIVDDFYKTLIRPRTIEMMFDHVTVCLPVRTVDRMKINDLF